MLKKFLLLSVFVPNIVFAASPVTVTDPGGLNAQTVNAAGAANVNLTNVNGATANIAQETGGNLATTATKLSATGTSSQNVQGSSAAAATDDASNPVKIGGVFMSTLPVYTTGQRGNVQLDQSGNTRVLMTALGTGMTDAIPNANVLTVQGSSTSGGGAKPLGVSTTVFNGTTWDREQSALGQIAGGGLGTGTAVEEAGESFVNITTATTTVVKSGAGVLHKVCENTIAASASISMFNNTAGSGASLGVITNPLTLLQMGPLCAVYDVYFSTGLTIVTTGVQNITVTFR